LVSYPNLKAFLRARPSYKVGKWCLDSGAFSVINSGKTVNLDEYISVTKDVDADEVFALDVVGDPVQGIKNFERHWAAGVKAIPTWHPGESWEVLKFCADNAEKIAFGSGAFSVKMQRARGTPEQWIAQAFARVWPKAVHGFGMVNPRKLNLVPWHSVDSSSWILQPSAYGFWTGYKQGVSTRVSARGLYDFRICIDEFQKRQRHYASFWARPLAQIAQPREET
jgi:hypothetical protein